MTTKSEMTIDYARRFIVRLYRRPSEEFLIHVNGEHVPLMIPANSSRAEEIISRDDERVAGVFRGSDSPTAEYIAECIDEVDDFVPIWAREDMAAELFSKKVRADSVTGCWRWTSAKSSTGHGYFWFEGKLQKAEIVSHLMNVGPIPEGMFVRRKCNTRDCVNPEHLELSTESESKYAPGHGNAKLSRHQVLAIKSCSLSPRELAKKYGVSRETISDIRNGRTWVGVEFIAKDNEQMEAA